MYFELAVSQNFKLIHHNKQLRVNAFEAEENMAENRHNAQVYYDTFLYKMLPSSSS